MRVKYAIPALAALLVLPAARLMAQGGAAAAPADSATKVGTLSIRQAIVNTAEGKLAQAELQSQFASRQTELENLRKQAQEAQSKLSQGERTLSDEEKARLARQIDVWTRQFQRKQEGFQEDVNAAQNEVVERIGQKMIEVLARYARENGYSLILDVSSNSTPVLFASPAGDVTQDIVRLYDQAHPVKGAPAAPAQPRPQPGQTRPPAPTPQKPPQQ